MPKQSLPTCTLHKPTGQARVRIDGKDYYLGPYGSPKAQREYRRLMAKWLQTHELPQRERERFTVGKLAAAYMEFAKSYYVKAAKPTSQICIVRNALRRLVRAYRKLPVDDLGPKRIKVLRLRLIEDGCSRKYINGMIGVIKGMLRWGMEEELIDGSSRNRALLAKGVCWLRQGRSAARESEPVRPVPEALIDAIQPHVSPVVWGLIRFQLATGARPGEAVRLRMRDVNTSGVVWEYRPVDHKTAHHGKERVVMIGPVGQSVLRDFMQAEIEAYLFSSDAAGLRPYRRDSYTLAVRRGCELAFGMPDKLRNPDRWLQRQKIDGAEFQIQRRQLLDDAAAWRREHVWGPNQLRHNFATRARRAAGLEAARVTLGHSSASVSEIYAERDMDAARAVVARIG